jgi:hypothetical protein
MAQTAQTWTVVVLLLNEIGVEEVEAPVKAAAPVCARIAD